jgi:peptidyl-prolyl cis-trans isomerase B (cyclophilin B)
MKRSVLILTAVIAFIALFFLGCQKKPLQVTIEMEKGGEIVIQLFPKDAPKTVNNFIKLANEKFYDGLIFHRVVPGFIVQGGDPKGNGVGGPGYTIKFESSGRLHLTGSVAMARKEGLDTAGSQFYICLKEQPHLNGKYCVFGQVIRGMDTVNDIKRGDKMKRVYVSSH